MKFQLVIWFSLCSGTLFSQTIAPEQERKSLFHYPKRSHQWDIGRTYFTYGNEQLSGATIDIWSVLNKAGKWGFGIDNVLSGGKNYTEFNNFTAAYRVRNYGMFFVKYERLIRPSRMIHFSTFFKAGYGGLTKDLIYSNQNMPGFSIASSSEEFFVLAPGANVLCNLYNNLALGAGAQYRFTSAAEKISFFSTNAPKHYAFSFFLRFTLPGTGKKYAGKSLPVQPAAY